MSSWIRVDTTVREHRKIGRVARALGISHATALGHLVMLWTWAHHHAPDGELADLEPEELAEAARWDGDVGAFECALVAARLLERTETGWLIHDWMERAEQLKSAKQKQKERARATTVARQSPDSRPDVREDRTGQDRQDRQDRQDPPLPPRGAADRPALALELGPDPTPTHRDRIAAVVAAWNDGAGDAIPHLAAPSKRTEKRDAKLRQALERHAEPDAWRWCARALALSPHHAGRNERGWVASCEWLLERGNGAKLDEWMQRGAEVLEHGARVVPALERRLTAAEATIERARARADALRGPQQPRQRASDTDPPPDGGGGLIVDCGATSIV